MYLKNFNRKFCFILLAVIILGILSGCVETKSGSSSSSDSGDESNTENKVTLTLAHQWAAPNDDTDGDYRSLLAKRFAEEVNEASNGEIEIEVYPANSLISPSEQFTSLQRGSVDMAIWAPFYDAGKVPEFSISLLPGIIQNYEQAWQWDNEEVGKEYDNLLEDNGVKKLVSAWGIFAVATKGDKAVINPEDVDGLLMRGAGKDSEKLLESLGAGIASMASSEIYSALQTNIIDGTLTSFDSFMSYRLFEVLDHFNYTGENAFLFSSNPLVVSTETWENKLNEQQREIIEQVSNDLQGWVKETASASNEVVANTFEDNGVEVHVMTEEESAKWFEASQPIVEDFASISERANRLVELARELHE